MMNVLVIGDVMLDHYLYGDCNRISPEAPVPVVNIKKEEHRLGGAANVASSLAALGQKSCLLGITGEDEYAENIDNIISTKSPFINNFLFKGKTRLTTVKSRVMVGGHQMIRLDRETTDHLNKGDLEGVITRFRNIVDQVNIILVSDYGKGLLTSEILSIIFQTAKSLEIPTIVDPKATDFSIYNGASLIKPNRKEAELATGIKIHDNHSLLQASLKIKEITQVDAVITTLSEDGVGLFFDNQLKIIPTKAVKVFDVTGAGDTFLAAFAYEYMRSGDLIEAGQFANFASAVVVAKPGSASASLEEINKIREEIGAYES